MKGWGFILWSSFCLYVSTFLFPSVLLSVYSSVPLYICSYFSSQFNRSSFSIVLVYFESSVHFVRALFIPYHVLLFFSCPILMFLCSFVSLFHFSVFYYSNLPLFQCSTIPIFHYSNLPLFQSFTIPIFHYSNLPLFQCSTIPIFHYSNILLFQSSTVPTEFVLLLLPYSSGLKNVPLLFNFRVTLLQLFPIPTRLLTIFITVPNILLSLWSKQSNCMLTVPSWQFSSLLYFGVTLFQLFL